MGLIIYLGVGCTDMMAVCASVVFSLHAHLGPYEWFVFFFTVMKELKCKFVWMLRWYDLD